MTNDQTVTQALKPCPFCGGEGLSHRVARGWRVSCKNCDAQPRPGLPPKTEAEAITAWNHRTAHSGDLAPGLERAALWHDARCKGPDVFEQELHEVSAKALRHLAANPDATDMQALDAAHSGEGRSLFERKRDELRQSGEGREGAEHCRKCGRDNPSWSAPSPLWNAVMRGGSIDGNPIHDDLVCPSCFIGLAMDAGIASGWRLIATEVNVLLETVTPSGRVWDDAAFLWVEQHSSHSGEGRSNGAGEDGYLKIPTEAMPRGPRRDAVLAAAMKLAPYSADPAGTPTRDGLVFLNAAINEAAAAHFAALSAPQGEVERLREALSGLEWTEDNLSLRTPYDGDVDGEGRHIVVGGDLIVTFDDSEIADKYRARVLAALQGEVERPDAEEDDRSWLGTSIDRIDAMEEAAQLRGVIAKFLPTNLDLDNRNIADDVIVPLDVTIGELRSLAALAQPEAGGE